MGWAIQASEGSKLVVGHGLELRFGDLAQSFDFVYWSSAGERLVVPLQRVYSVGVQRVIRAKDWHRPRHF